VVEETEEFGTICQKIFAIDNAHKVDVTEQIKEISTLELSLAMTQHLNYFVDSAIIIFETLLCSFQSTSELMNDLTQPLNFLHRHVVGWYLICNLLDISLNFTNDERNKIAALLGRSKYLNAKTKFPKLNHRNKFYLETLMITVTKTSDADVRKILVCMKVKAVMTARRTKKAITLKMQNKI